TNTLTGPTLDTTWHVTGPDAGDLRGPSFLRFGGVENLTGGAGNRDTFVFTQGGALSGTVEGGAGGYDTVVLTGAYGAVGYELTGPQAGNILPDGRLLRYGGMEPIQFTQSQGAFTYTGTIGNDTISLHDTGGSDGMMEISGTGETVQFVNPTKSLTIKGGGGD